MFQITSREIDVLVELLRDGASNEVIGKRAFMAYDTVKDHMKNLLRKSGAPSRTALALGVLRGTLVPVQGWKARDGEVLQRTIDVGELLQRS